MAVLIVLLAVLVRTGHTGKQPDISINQMDELRSLIRINYFICAIVDIDSIANYNISAYLPVSVATAFYSFNNGVLDLYCKRDGIINGGPVSYIDGYVGYGRAILLSQTNLTSIFVANSFYLTKTSYTLVYLSQNVTYAGIIQFSSLVQLDINDGQVEIVLPKADRIKSPRLSIVNQWHHIAVVYDSSQAVTFFYIDGVSVGQAQYQQSGTDFFRNVTVTIGSRFVGALDQLSVSLGAKTEERILWAATTAAFYPFEGQTNGITPAFGPNTTLAGVQTVLSQVRNAAHFNVSGAYVQAPGFTALNLPQHAFTVALWIQPSTNAGIFLTIANSVSCLLILGLRDSDNALVAYLPNTTYSNSGISLVGSKVKKNQWTHIALTWSPDRQAQLYQNTTWQGKDRNAIKTNNAQGTPMTINLGLYRDSVNCEGGDELNSTNQFTGSIDEFYVFS